MEYLPHLRHAYVQLPSAFALKLIHDIKHQIVYLPPHLHFPVCKRTAGATVLFDPTKEALWRKYQLAGANIRSLINPIVDE